MLYPYYTSAARKKQPQNVLFFKKMKKKDLTTGPDCVMIDPAVRQRRRYGMVSK
jgi:hypothetical protein